MRKPSLTITPFNNSQVLFLTNFTYTDADEKIWEVVAEEKAAQRYGFGIVRPILKIKFPATIELIPLVIKRELPICFGFFGKNLTIVI
jgi:hypothetical protein